jgi:hypothetical protein
MSQPLKDAEHLVRMAGLFAVGVVVFLVLRAVLTPADFGELGHYRTGALDDNLSVEPRFAGRSVCEDCHDTAPRELAEGAHSRVGCEACHGPLAVHVSDPDVGIPPELDGSALCASCHAAEAAKPAWFPQVVPEEHAGDEACVECHLPHQPGI